MVSVQAIRALECGWVVQLNGDGTFGFCHVAVDMIGLGFCSMGGANVQRHMKSDGYKEGKLPIDQVQCDHQAG